MFRLAEFAAPVLFLLWLYCVFDVIMTSEQDARNLPKMAWLFIVLLFPFVGSIAWLVAGKPQSARVSSHERPTPAFPEYDRPGRAAAADPVADEEFLRKVRERAEAQREAERIHRRKLREDAGD